MVLMSASAKLRSVMAIGTFADSVLAATTTRWITATRTLMATDAPSKPELVGAHRTI
jgi:hypothetical protein